MILSTLCYIEKDGCWLMLHRVKKKNDVNHDKWIGVGGKFEEGESPEDCLLREVREETGLTLTEYRFRGLVTFVSNEAPTEYMHLLPQAVIPVRCGTAMRVLWSGCPSGRWKTCRCGREIRSFWSCCGERKHSFLLSCGTPEIRWWKRCGMASPCRWRRTDEAIGKCLPAGGALPL